MTDYEWYRTKSIGSVARIKENHGCVWCPLCHGRGRIPNKTGGFLDRFFHPQITCPRCHGRCIVPASSIKPNEIKELVGYDRAKVDNSIQPGPRREQP